jgi:Leucine-rich repeat (LRR) protein/phosphohistidine swiveling domain-containing protein
MDCTCGRADVNHVSVDCRYILPKSVPEKAFSLQLKYMEESIETISQGTLKIRNAQNLSKLDIESQVTTIEARAFEDFPELVMLDLSRNSISSISPESFVGMPKLETLLLSRNNLTSIPDNAFTPLGNLKALYIEVNYLARIPAPLPTQLRILSLRSNVVTSVDVPLDQSYVMPRLAQVDLCENNFTSFANPPFSVDDLKILCVGGNEVDFGPRILSRMTNVESLDLNANFANTAKKAELSADLIKATSGMKKLQALRVENYVVQDFAFLGNLTSLTTLTLNRVPDRPVSNLITLNALPRLCTFYLKRSPSIAAALLSTPALISFLRRLTSLSIPSNGVQTFPLLAATIFRNLDSLDISQNPLRCDCTFAWVKERHDAGEIFVREHMNTHCHNTTLNAYVELVDNKFTCPKIVDVEAVGVPEINQPKQATPNLTSEKQDVTIDEQRGLITAGDVNSTSSSTNESKVAVKSLPTTKARFSTAADAHSTAKTEDHSVTSSAMVTIILCTCFAAVGAVCFVVFALMKYRTEKAKKRNAKLNEAAIGEDEEGDESKQVTYSRLGPGDD